MLENTEYRKDPFSIFEKKLTERKDLPTEHKAELSAIFIEVENIPEIEEAEVPHILDELSTLNLDENKIAESVTAIKNWVAVDAKKRSMEVEKMVAKLISNDTSKNKFNFSLLRLLGETSSLGEDIFVDDGLAKALELNTKIDNNLMEQFRAINRSNDPRHNLAFHKILDFLRKHQTTVQNHIEDEIEQDGEYYNGLIKDFVWFAEREIDLSQNYLIQCHIRDIIETRQMFNSPKAGSLAGVPGGASDETIYSFSHTEGSYSRGLALGLDNTYPIKNPILPISMDCTINCVQGI